MTLLGMLSESLFVCSNSLGFVFGVWFQDCDLLQDCSLLQLHDACLVPMLRVLLISVQLCKTCLLVVSVDTKTLGRFFPCWMCPSLCASVGLDTEVAQSGIVNSSSIHDLPSLPDVPERSHMSVPSGRFAALSNTSDSDSEHALVVRASSNADAGGRVGGWLFLPVLQAVERGCEWLDTFNESHNHHRSSTSTDVEFDMTRGPEVTQNLLNTMQRMKVTCRERL